MPKKITPDLPLGDDGQPLQHFDFETYADTLVRLLASKSTKTPLAILVSGDWGSGKTTLLRRIRAKLEAENISCDSDHTRSCIRRKNASEGLFLPQ